MSKSYIATLSFFTSLIITVCTVLSIGAAEETLATLSGKAIIVSLLLPLKSLIEAILPYFVYLLAFVLALKLLNTVACNHFINFLTSVIDIAVFVFCLLIFVLNISLLTWIAFSCSIINFIYNVVFRHAQM